MSLGLVHCSQSTKCLLSSLPHLFFLLILRRVLGELTLDVNRFITVVLLVLLYRFSSFKVSFLRTIIPDGRSHSSGVVGVVGVVDRSTCYSSLNSCDDR